MGKEEIFILISEIFQKISCAIHEKVLKTDSPIPRLLKMSTLLRGAGYQQYRQWFMLLTTPRNQDFFRTLDSTGLWIRTNKLFSLIICRKLCLLRLLKRTMKF